MLAQRAEQLGGESALGHDNIHFKNIARASTASDKNKLICKRFILGPLNERHINSAAFKQITNEVFNGFLFCLAPAAYQAVATSAFRVVANPAHLLFIKCAPIELAPWYRRIHKAGYKFHSSSPVLASRSVSAMRSKS